MIATKLVTKELSGSDKVIKPSCTNCIHGHYWHDSQTLEQPESFGFDCNYPNIGSKSDRNIYSGWFLDDEEMAAECPEYQRDLTAD
jgi:hypothetical protein